MFDFIQSRNILRSKECRTIFRNAEIDGSIFLERGNIGDYWLHQCSLPAAASGHLARLSQMIKEMEKKESGGNAFHFGSDEPAYVF